MELNKIVAELKTEKDRLDRAIAALESSDGRRRKAVAKKAAPSPVVRATKKRGGISAAGRKRLSDAMKKRWIDRKKKAAKASS